MSMDRTQFERASVRISLALGFCVTLGLWMYTGYSFNQRIDGVRKEASDVAARYMRAQELLSTVRAQVLLSSVRVRDALLNPERQAVEEHRIQVEQSYHIVTMALEDYEPVAGASPESDQMVRLRAEFEQFHQTSIDVLRDAAGRSPAAIRDLLNRHVVPRREAALAISEEIQALNRQAFIRQQSEITNVHQVAELKSRQQLGLALMFSLGVLLFTSLYAAKLEARLRMQLKRDVLISRELHETATRLMSAQEEERRTIARELHDEVGQVLTAIKVELSIAQRSIEASGASAAPLADVQSIADGALHTVRNLTQLLHPAALDDLGLAAAIDASLRGLARRHDIRAELHQTGPSDRWPKEIELAAYRIVQEGVTNIGKHAKATHCDVNLTYLHDRLLIEVNDDGVGFDAATEGKIGRAGLGLVSVRERAARLGGTFNILSGPGRGTRLIVSLPSRVAHA